MSPLDFYRALEKLVAVAERDSEALADKLREAMDIVWYKRLSASDRALVNAREQTT